MSPQTLTGVSGASTSSSNSSVNLGPLPTTVIVTSNSCNATNNPINTNTKLKFESSSIIRESNAVSTSLRTSTLPTLQWPWNGSITLSTDSVGVQSQSKKRLGLPLNGTEATSSKKPRITTTLVVGNDIVNNNMTAHSNTGTAISKKLKAAAREESQTKITGYFKSQIKSPVTSENTTDNSRQLSGITSNEKLSAVNSLTINAPATTASLNKYFNILAQLKDQNNSNSVNNIQDSTNLNNNLASNVHLTNIVSNSGQCSNMSNSLAIAVAPIPIPALKKIERSKPTKIAQVAPNLRKTPTNSNYLNTSVMTTNGVINGKSPAKKHVAIAPRTPDMKHTQQQHHNMFLNKQETIKQISTVTPAMQTASVQNAPNPQQPTVLLTAIRLPQVQATTPAKYTGQLTKLTGPVSNFSTSTMNTSVTATNSSSTTTLYQLPVQLPNIVQLPSQMLTTNGTNVMHLNNIATAVAKSSATTTQSGTGTIANVTPVAAVSSSQAAQSAAAQYFFNGTVFKLQQFTTATTTTATSAIGAATNGNPFNLLSANDLQDIFIKQQQQQQQQHYNQIQQQQQQHKSSIASATGASFQEIFQQQIAAAIAANQQQQQQQAQLQQLQRLSNSTNLQQQPVFMATPAGLVLNAASLPAMLAQAATALAVSNHQTQKTIALPALQPIQQNSIPALNSIFTSQTQQQTINQADCDFQQQLTLTQHHQKQFLTASQPPPLSSVTLATTNNANFANNIVSFNNNFIPQLHNTAQLPQQLSQPQPAKVHILKAAVSPTTYTTLSSQPPPLVTISNTKTRSHIATPVVTSITTSITSTSSSSSTQAIMQKPSAIANPYQKRSSNKILATQIKISSPNKVTATVTSSSKITSASGKIIVTSTTPPPLVPTVPTVPIASSQANVQTSTAITITRGVTSVSKTSSIPTPALVSIANNSTYLKQILKNTPNMDKGDNINELPVVNVFSKTATSINTTPITSFTLEKNLIKNIKNKIISNTLSESTNHKQTSSDLFDLVKNSTNTISTKKISTNKKISTDSLCYPPSFCSLESSSSSSLSSTVSSSVSLPKSFENFNKVCEKSMEELSIESIFIKKEENSSVDENLISFSGKLLNHTDIKEELTNDDGKLDENTLILDNTSFSFSSHSNSVSSAADLSLETTATASISRSISGTPSSSYSLLSQTPSCFINNQPIVLSNSLNDSTSSSCVTGNLSHDMFSEMVTSTSSLSESSPSNISIKLKTDVTTKRLKKETDITANDIDPQKRDLPSPESGIGGSLSNTESLDFSPKSITSEHLPSSGILENQLSPSPSPSLLNVEEHSSEALLNKPNVLLSETMINKATKLHLYSCKTNNEHLRISSVDTTVTTNVAHIALPKSAISPILSQPKTIRFPAESCTRHGMKGAKRHDGVCYWDKCNKKHESNSKLLDHMQTQHVNTQTGPFACLWVGCKVYNKESCSRRWLERHVLSHGGSKQFKCIVEGCGLRFGSQLALQKHVNSHFNNVESKENSTKRTSDPPVPKQLRKNGKKLRYRRQPFSARMFDFFDAGIMEGVQHRLRQMNILLHNCDTVVFRGFCIMQRSKPNGTYEGLIRWWPQEIIDDEWLSFNKEQEFYSKRIELKHMSASQKIKIESLLRTSYKLPCLSTLVKNENHLKIKTNDHQEFNGSDDDNENDTTNNSNNGNDDNDDSNEDDDDEDDDDDDDNDDNDDNDDDGDDDDDDDDDDDEKKISNNAKHNNKNEYYNPPDDNNYKTFKCNQNFSYDCIEERLLCFQYLQKLMDSQYERNQVDIKETIQSPRRPRKPRKNSSIVTRR